MAEGFFMPLQIYGLAALTAIHRTYVLVAA